MAVSGLTSFLLGRHNSLSESGGIGRQNSSKFYKQVQTQDRYGSTWAHTSHARSHGLYKPSGHSVYVFPGILYHISNGNHRFSRYPGVGGSKIPQTIKKNLDRGMELQLQSYALMADGHAQRKTHARWNFPRSPGSGGNVENPQGAGCKSRSRRVRLLQMQARPSQSLGCAGQCRARPPMPLG